MKKQIPILIVFVTGILMVLQYFVPHATSEFLFTYANDFVIVIGILALPLGIFSLMRGTVIKARKDPRERFYALVTIAGFLIMVYAGIKRSQFTAPGTLNQNMFNYVMIPCQATIFSMLA